MISEHFTLIGLCLSCSPHGNDKVIETYAGRVSEKNLNSDDHFDRSFAYIEMKGNIGLTRDLRQRMKDHSDGRSLHTKKFRPWILVAYFAFTQENMAIAFEKYLKSGSGRAFIKRHFS
jgi:putative endonuclease